MEGKPGQEIEILDDAGLSVRLEGLPLERVAAEPLTDGEIALTRSEQIALEFIDHPRRDVTVSALAIGGLGFAVGAAVFSRRLH